MKQIRISSAKRLIAYVFKENKLSMAIVILCVLLSAVATSLSGIFLFVLIDYVITPAITSGFDSVSSLFTGLIIAMALIYLLGALSTLVYSQIMARVGQKTLNKLRKEMFSSMEKLPIRYFDTHKNGDIMSNYTNDIDAIRQFISQSMVQIINTAFTLIVLTVFMLLISLWLTIVVYASAIAMFVVVKEIGGRSATKFKAQQNSTAKLEGFIQEAMSGEKVIKVFTHEEEIIEDFKKHNDEVKEDSSIANEYANIVMPLLSGIGNFLYVLLAVIGGVLLLFGASNISLVGVSAITTATILSFIPMGKQFGQAIAQVSQQTSMCAMAFAGADRVFALIDEKPEEDNGYVTLVHAKKDAAGNLVETEEETRLFAWKHPHHDGTTTLSELKGEIVLDHVDFAYEEGHNVLVDLTIHAESGQKIAFVGATGAGKTTITNLINRFYDIADGKIRYDGININKIKKADLRKSLTVVLQDTNLFTGTIRENIRYGRLEATDEEVIEAAKLANAYDFITRLPNGFDTMLTGDGANLSQGQRQLLSIARAAIAKTPLLIMDEATSSIDTRTEQIVQKGTDKLMEGRTVFVIAHRLSTVQNSDKIIVLEHGHIAEEGNHSTLMALKGQYYRLYTGAFELE